MSSQDRDLPFEGLDFIYMPSSDVAADLGFYRDVLGGEIVFAIEAFGTRVAQVRLEADAPRLLLAEHLEGEAPVLLHRVSDLDHATAELEREGSRSASASASPTARPSRCEAPGASGSRSTS